MARGCEGSHYEPRLADGFAKLQFKSAIVEQIYAQDETLLVPGPTKKCQQLGPNPEMTSETLGERFQKLAIGAT